ncbi:MAG: O-antigen ligase family protein [Ruminococcus sp.]|nr:O-antigen ligase family protein [Ruminococcus sp.]
MTGFKEMLEDSSKFRILYIMDLFFCNISFLQIPAYILLVFLFGWGAKLSVRNQRQNNTFFKMRFGLWIGAFLILSMVSILLNFSVTFFYSAVMLIHVFICFFIFYGMHTEPNFDFKKELYTASKLVVYFTTIANIIGIFCLMFGINFEWEWIKFTIYENRFTGVYVNPNLLGFCSVVSLVCCHILSKENLYKTEGCRPISKIWLVTCLVTNLFSLILCDSNASLVLALGYAIVYIAYLFFADKSGLKPSEIILKITAVMLSGIFIVCSSLIFRTVFQTGFAVVTAKTTSFVEVLFNKDEIIGQSGELADQSRLEQEKNQVTFEHLNENADSGRFKLWRESIDLFKISPIIGIANGNIVSYSGEYLNGALSYTYHESDLHNGFLTILVSTGIIGFMLFGTFGFRFAKHAAQHLFLQKKTFRNDVYPCLFAFLFAYLGYSLFEKALLYDISFMVMWFWLFMGYTSCYISGFEPMLETQYLFRRERLTRTML